MRDDRRIIPAAVIDGVRANGDRAARAKGESRRLMSSMRRDMSYRSGWRVANDAPRCVFAMGVYGQNLFRDFERRIVVAKLSSWKKAEARPPFLATHWAFARLQKALGRAGGGGDASGSNLTLGALPGASEMDGNRTS